MHSIDKLLPHAKWAGFVATCLAAAIAASFGWSQGEGVIGRLCLAVGLALASFIVGYSLVFAYAAAKRGMKVVAFAASALFVVAVCVELLSHLGYTAASRQHDLSIAQHQTTTYTDVRGEIDRARTELANLPNGKPAPAIEAEMAGMRSRVGWERSRQCSDPGAYPTFCRQYAGLASSLESAKRRAALDRRIQDLTAKSASSGEGHSTVGAQSNILAAIATQSTKPSAEQQFWTNIGISALLAVFFVMSGLLNFIAYAFEPEPLAAARPTGALNDNIRQFQAPVAQSPIHTVNASTLLEFASRTSTAKVA